MNDNYIPVGTGRVYRDARTGAIAIDSDSIGRQGFAGEEEAFEQPPANPEYGYAFDEDAFGASRPRYPNYPQAPRQPYPQAPRQPYPQAPAQSREPIVDKNKDGVPDGWISTFLTGSTTIDAAGQANVVIRSQHPFLATDVTFEGSAAGAKINQIMFGSRQVVNANDGIPTTVFTPTSQMRKHLEGQKLKAGLDIVVTGTLTGPGTLSAVFFGYKPPET
jgi:hypothetical protein